ncbi:MAG: chemotaxis protein CheW [Methylovulum sp.]|jgi:purine-binding chemotaxis protein CheW
MDVVIFELDQQYFALPTHDIVEVLDPLPVTALPFAPAYVDGLVNVAGRVVLQIDAARLLEMTLALPITQGSLLIVTTLTATVAVHIEKVMSKDFINDEALSYCVEKNSSATSPFQVKNKEAMLAEFQWRDKVVLLLDTRIFALEQLPELEINLKGGQLLGSTSRLEEMHTETVDSHEDFSCLMLECNHEQYALRLPDVGEIVDVLTLTPLPHANNEIAGLALLRGAPLLVLSLGRLLGHSLASVELQMVVVEVQGMKLALLVDKVLGIERFSKDALQIAELGLELEGYLINKQGKMAGLLCLEGLITRQRLEQYCQFIVQNHTEAKLDRTATKQRLLSFFVGSEYCALPLHIIERVEEYREYTDVPGGSAELSGVVQVQGAVTPVVDLRRIMGLSTQTAATAFLVVRLSDGVLAVMVDRIGQVLELPDTDIEAVKHASTEYITAVGRLNGKLLSILTLEPLNLAA